MKKIIGLFIILGVIGVTVWQLANHEERMHAEDYLQLGIEYGVAGKHEDAIEAFKKAIQENPNYPSAYLNLGNAYGNTERYKESIAVYKEGIQMNPRHSEVPQMEMNIAWIANKMNDKKTAVLFSQKAIQSFTDRNNLAGVTKAASQLRMIEQNTP